MWIRKKIPRSIVKPRYRNTFITLLFVYINTNAYCQGYITNR